MGLGGDARMVIDQMVFDPATQTGVQAFSLVQGAFVIASGAIGKFDPESVSVRTPVATIGIRGQTYGVSLDAISGETTVPILAGASQITNDQGAIELRTAGPPHTEACRARIEGVSKCLSLGSA